MRCAVCEKPVDVASLDSPHPEAPTLFQALHPEVLAPLVRYRGREDAHRVLLGAVRASVTR